MYRWRSGKKKPLTRLCCQQWSRILLILNWTSTLAARCQFQSPYPYLLAGEVEERGGWGGQGNSGPTKNCFVIEWFDWLNKPARLNKHRLCQLVCFLWTLKKLSFFILKGSLYLINFVCFLNLRFKENIKKYLNLVNLKISQQNLLLITFLQL